METPLSFEAYDSFILAAALEEKRLKIRYIKHLISNLSKSYRFTLMELFSCLFMISQNAQNNKMDAKRLAKVIGPLIVRPAIIDYYMQHDTALQMEITELMISDFESIFVPDDSQGKRRLSFGKSFHQSMDIPKHLMPTTTPHHANEYPFCHYCKSSSVITFSL